MQHRFIVLLLWLSATTLQLCAQKEQDVLEYIARYKDMAMNEMKRTGIPAAIKLAQGIHETEAGKSDLVTRSNNHFGIKCKTNWTGPKVFHDDDARGECFRSYSRAEDSYTDHSDFLKNSPRYAFLFGIDPTDYQDWAYGLKKAGYATNIRYSQVLIRLIEKYHLQDYTLIALGRMNETDRSLAGNSNMPSLPLPEQVDKPETGSQEQGTRPSYPPGPFVINKTKVIYVPSGRAWLSIAEEYNIPLSRLLDFNDLEEDDDILAKDQLVYLQRKRKVGAAEFHIMQKGEDLYDICQLEAIRYESLLNLNHLNGNKLPAAGEKLYLQYAAPAMPSLANGQDVKLLPASTAQTAGKKHAFFTTHMVTTKETLYSISRKYNVGPDQIKEWNRLDSLNLRIGQELIIYRNN